jgi:putative sterol carrier protein
VATHPTLRRFFDPLVAISRLRGRIPYDEHIDGSGFEGVIAYEFTGDQGGSWHCVLERHGIRFERGPATSPRATLVMTPATFADLLAGRAAYSTAMMTGRVRIRGDGHAGMLLGALVTRFRAMSDQPGWRGRLARLHRRFVLGG